MEIYADIRVVIVAYNSDPYLSDCILALANQSHKNFEVVIVDNGGATSDDGYHVIDFPDARFVQDRNPQNTGFAGGTNRGASGARTKWVMSLNPDTVLEPGCLKALLDAAAIYNDAEIISPRLFSDLSHDKLDGLGDSLSITGLAWRNAYRQSAKRIAIPPVVEVFSATGAAALYLRESYEKAGGINPVFFCYMEDIDLALRLRAYGGVCLLVNDAVGYHAGGHSTKGIPGFALKYSARNTPLLIISSSPLPLLLPFLMVHILGQIWLQWRNRGTETARFRAQGHREARKLAGRVFRQRFKRKAYPFGATIRVAKRLDWSPTNFKTHNLKYWNIEI